MTRHRFAAVTLAGALSLVAGASCAQTGATPAQNAAPVAREYKIRVEAERCDERDEREQLFRLVAALPPAAPVPDKAIDAKRCRRVAYLDTSEQALRSAGYIVRTREKLKDRKCKVADVESVDLTLKVRGDATRIGEVRHEAWANDAEVEEDVLVGPTATGSSLAVSAKRKSGPVPADVGALRAAFPGVLPAADGATQLETSCRVAYERRWELEVPGIPAGGEPPELAIWYRSPSGEPWLAELSFKAKLDNDAAVAWARALAARLQEVLADMLAPPQSKTEALYSCGDQDSPE